jgi:hypothetical protein
MDESPAANLPLLPLLVWKVPPGLEMALAQEGVPWVRLENLDASTLIAGRFVLFHGRMLAAARVRNRLLRGQRAIDVRGLRGADGLCAAMIDTTARRAFWDVGAGTVEEHVARVDRGEARARLMARLREAVLAAGGVWVRLAAYPHPYRSAFNLRVDLDEPAPEDYARFARLRGPLEDCTTHFVSTHAYGRDRAVLGDLRGRDTQSHGHFHHVYRDEASNRRNLGRAQELLNQAGIEPEGFAAPGGRWNRGLDRALEALGYRYSSDFALGRDDWPFFPWLGARFSPVLQVPIHPVCEGIFFEAGIRDERLIADYFEQLVARKIASGQPAFVYGHPERRLAHLPGVLARLAEAVRGEQLLWRVTLTRFARWWRWRMGLRWSVTAAEGRRLEVRFDELDGSFTPALEVVRDLHAAHVPVTARHLTLDLDSLAFERRRLRADLPAPLPARVPWSFRGALRQALDWETVTPLAELPARTVRQRLKRRLRRWREGGRP